jgi:hypothetical protein
VWWKLALIVLLTLLLANLLLRHVPGMNGPWYWKWPWRALPFFPLYPALALAAAPAAAAYVLRRRRQQRVAEPADDRLPVLLLTLATLALSLTAVFVHTRPYGPWRLVSMVRSPIVNSYFSDAAALQANIAENPALSTRLALRDWPLLLPHFHQHSRFKPPGLVMYYLMWIKLLGPSDAAAAAGGILLALLGALRVPAAYWFVRTFARDRQAAWETATFVALSPGLVLFLPMFDTFYPAIACLLLILWARALERGRAADALAFGALLALGLFLSYIFLVFGVFMVSHALLKIADAPAVMSRRVLRQGAIASATIVALYALLYAATGFDPLETSRAIGPLVMRDLVQLSRPYPQHVFFDVLDFGMSAGWIAFPLVLFLVLPVHPALRRPDASAAPAAPAGPIRGMTPAARLVLLCLLQIVTVALVALLPGEAARLWLPMLPLLIAPAALELTRWPFAARIGVYACLWLMLAVLCQNLAFVFDPFQRPPAPQ